MEREKMEEKKNGRKSFPHVSKKQMGILVMLVGGILFYYFSRPPVIETGVVVSTGSVKEYVENTKEQKASDTSLVIELKDWEPMRMKIPVLDFDMEVVNGGVFDEELLRKAPVHFEMSDLPGTEKGNTAFAAHRRGSYAFFRDLDELNPGDQIILETETHRFVYEMAWLKIVDPYDWSVIDSTEKPALTLQTCEPKNHPGTHRLIARAYLEVAMPKEE
ncbi:class E sortase [Tindallia californiensis]|uniref:LPXTG-site transpeptidase (Sortase) family protein n=1 Tax=Tindallia californiensis TaxID=159292 RepID=A0A1H3Q563_9FIRM|nr:class E sortase [Tindallia californiensis]SDZ08393.1 LPXTG-site transpeptidase (sortase) family protein [Tindallia californiensis]